MCSGRACSAEDVEQARPLQKILPHFSWLNSYPNSILTPKIAIEILKNFETPVGQPSRLSCLLTLLDRRDASPTSVWYVNCYFRDLITY